MSNKEIMDLPTAEQLDQELKRLRNRHNFISALRSTVASLIVICSIAVLISTMVMPVLRVTGSSMTPTLQNNQVIVCSRITSYDKGDIIAFYYNNKVLIKRVIGVAGDTINIAEDGTVFVNGNALDEPYVSELALGECDIELPYNVSEGRIFVIGDNRPLSVDSRSSAIGAISTELIVGKVEYVVYPFKDFRKVE